MISISRSPIAWLIFTALALATTILTIHLFPRAFAMVQLDVTMDRVQALQEATILADTLKLGPSNAQQAASFVTDDLVKTFVELEGGGLTGFTGMISQQLYQPYTWQVRHFKPYETHELLIKYTPDGKPYGFIETIAENAPGNTISAAQAQQIAEQYAREQWYLSLDHFTLVEPSKEIRPNGRVDHSFVYQRTDATVAEGFYRLRIIVTGDKVTQLNHFVQVPDNFLRRYQHMRSANEMISWIALLIMLFLYILGSVIGLVCLMRRGWVLWRLPLFCGLFIAIGLVLMRINSLPLLWMHYKTSLSSLNFVLSIVTQTVYQFVYTTLLYTLIFAAAESLTRKAFGNQPQFWHIWTAQAARSYQVLGRTLLGYLVVPFFLLFVIVFYITVNTYLQWWIPSQAFFEPNILATYLPWLSSVVQALSAGFMEECLFRAIPLASALLLGKRYGYPTIWVASAFVLQALVFGAAHANYPMQPAYARLIELIIPSFGFGALYLAYGLLPGIIAHVVYDIAWMALPIFVSSSPQAFYNQIMVIALASLPLCISLYYRIKLGAWSSLPTTLYNNLWRPSVSITKTQEIPTEPTPFFIKKTALISVFLLGFVGLGAWLACTQFISDAPAISIDRSSAKTIALEHLTTHYHLPEKPWHLLTKISDDEYSSMPHTFIWQVGNKGLYRSLLNSYLTPPHWVVRFAQFDGDLEQCAEEYRVHIDGAGAILHTHHKLPESASGHNLTEAQARIIAHNTLKELYNLDPAQLTEIGACAQKRPARTDWIFTFADTRDYPISQGQQRIALEIAGDTLVNYKKFIFVPEEWQRNHENETLIAAIIKQFCGLLIYLMFIVAALVSLWYFAQSSQITGNLLRVSFFTFLVIYLLKIYNSTPKIFFEFSTSKPFSTQLYMMLGSLLISAVMQSLALAFTFCITRSLYRHYTLANQFVFRIPTSQRYIVFGSRTISICLGIGLGFITAGFITITQWAIPAVKPLWSTYNYLNGIMPLYDYMSVNCISYISFTLLVLLIINMAHLLLVHTTHKYSYPLLFLSLCAFIFAGIYYADNIPLMISIAGGLSMLLIASFYSLLRFDHTIIPVATASYTILTLVQQNSFAAYPQLSLHTCITIAIISTMSISWYWLLNKTAQALQN